MKKAEMYLIVSLFAVWACVIAYCICKLLYLFT